MSDPITQADTAESLTVLSSRLAASNADEDWRTTAAEAKSLADRLRERSKSNLQNSLGSSSLAPTLESILEYALQQPSFPNEISANTLYELMRLGANFCSDNDENRQRVLDAGIPRSLITLFGVFTAKITAENRTKPLDLSVSELALVKTAIGFLLNASIGYEPIKENLRSLKAVETLLKLSSAIFPIGAWSTGAFTGDNDWPTRATLSNWSWRVITELREDAKPFLGPDILHFLTPSLAFFSLPYPTVTDSTAPTTLSSQLIQTDFENLEESVSLIETLCLDDEDVRLSLARGLVFPEEHHGIPCLSNMLDFLEKATYPGIWSVLDEADAKGKRKTFDFFKAAIIKSIVEVAAEEHNADVLWDAGESAHPGGVFVGRMMNWIKSYTEAPKEDGREDLATCATLVLANLATKETFSATLLAPPHSITTYLVPLLGPTQDLRVRHGVAGLLRHLLQSSVQSSANKAILADAGIIEALVSSGIWDETKDALAEVVQINAFGISKHMCNGNATAACALVIPPKEGAASGLAQILALVRRSDTVAIKSEGTRVIVNVIKSLWASEAPALAQKKQEAVKAVLISDVTDALARLIGRSMKYPLLVNEAIVALSLLATQSEGASLVLKSLTTPLPAEVSNSSDPTSSAMDGVIESPIATSPPTSLPLRVNRRQADYLVVAVLRNAHGAGRTVPVNYPPEVRMNACSLLTQIAKAGFSEDGANLRSTSTHVLEELAKQADAEGKDGLLGTAAKKTLSAYAAAV